MEVIDKLIPLLEQGGEGAFWLAVLYLAKGYFNGILFAGVIVFIANMVRKVVLSCDTGAKFGMEVLNAAAPGRNNYGYFSKADESTCKRFLNDLIQKANQND